MGGVAFTAVFLAHLHGLGALPRDAAEAPAGTTSTSSSSTSSRTRKSPRRCSGLTKPYRKLVAIRSTQNLFMLEQALAETDPDTTDVIVMTAHRSPRGNVSTVGPNLDYYDRDLMTAVVERAEKAGKEVRPLILPTNNPLFAVVQTASNLEVQELILGASNLFTAEAQLDQVALYWINLHGGEPRPLTVRLLSRSRDIYFDLGGGNRIPKISERRARSVAELRAAGVGVRRVLLVHNATAEGSDLFGAVLTMLDPLVWLTVVARGARRPGGAVELAGARPGAGRPIASRGGGLRPARQGAGRGDRPAGPRRRLRPGDRGRRNPAGNGNTAGRAPIAARRPLPGGAHQLALAARGTRRHSAGNEACQTPGVTSQWLDRA